MTVNINNLEESVRTIDITPRWTALVKLYCEWLENGKESQKELARKEIDKLARFVDKVNDRAKKAEKQRQEDYTAGEGWHKK